MKDGYTDIYSEEYGSAMSRLFYKNFKNDININEHFRNDMNLNAGSTDTGAYKEITSYQPSYIEKVELSVSPSKTKEGNYVVLGPFQINKVNGAVVNSIEITDGDKSFSDINNGAFEYAIDYGQSSEKWSKEINNISSGKKFHIRFEDRDNTYDGDNWKVRFGSDDVYNARIMLSTSKGDSQNKLIYSAIKVYSAEYDIVEEKTNTLRVVKYGISASGETKQTGVGFIINKSGEGYLKYKNADQIIQIGKMEYNDTDFEWIQEKDNATIFETVDTDDGWTGYFQIEQMPAGTYHIGEVYNNNSGYESSVITRSILERYEGDTLVSDTLITDILQNDNISGYTNGLQVMTISLKEDGYTKVLRVYDSKDSDTSNLNIYMYKMDSIFERYLNGAEFKIKVYLDDENNDNMEVGWLGYNDGTYLINKSFEEATIWSSSEESLSNINSNEKRYAIEKGKIAIYGLNPNYKYEIHEITPATNGYELYGQTTRGMIVKVGDSSTKLSTDNYIEEYESISCATVSKEENVSNVIIRMSNYLKSVGEDPTPTPTPTYVDISGVVWIDQTPNKDGGYDDLYNTSVAPDTLLKEGKIRLVKKSDNSIDMEIDLSSLTGEKYTFSGEDTKITSSTLSNYYIQLQYEKIDVTYNIVAPREEQNASKAKYQSKGIASTDSIDVSNASNMNIGLVARDNTSDEITKDVAYIKTEIKGKEYVYYYGTKNTVGGLTTVDVGNSTYSRRLYASDIAYSLEENVTEGLEVSITYRITVKNNSQLYSNYYQEWNLNYPGVYLNPEYQNHERYMQVDVYDEYDPYYYKFINEDDGITGKKDYWENLESQSKVKSNLKLNINESKTLYVTYQLKETALTEILEKGVFTNGKQAYMEGNHYLARYEWSYDLRRPDGSVKSVYKWNQYNTAIYKYDPAPGMTFTIAEHLERKISGTVFKDNKDESKYTSTGEVVGNGIYETNENVIESVKVELLEPKIESGEVKLEPANVYNKDGAKKATTKTDNKGYYEFSGIIPR